MAEQSAQLEQDAARTRARMSQTTDQLRARLTTGQFLDQLTAYTREGPVIEFSRNLAREMREHPLPLVLIGIGVAWLIIERSRSSHRLEAQRSDYLDAEGHGHASGRAA